MVTAVTFLDLKPVSRTWFFSSHLAVEGILDPRWSSHISGDIDTRTSQAAANVVNTTFYEQ